jgi:hypothetical protein
MKSIYAKLDTEYCEYVGFAYQGIEIDKLWGFLSDIKNPYIDPFIDWIQAKSYELYGGGTGTYYTMLINNYVYIGHHWNELTDEQDLKFKENSKYFFKIKKEDFINLLQQWKTIYLQHPHGIVVKELADGSWKVKTLTVQDVAKCKTAVDPKTKQLPGDFTL